MQASFRHSRRDTPVGTPVARVRACVRACVRAAPQAQQAHLQAVFNEFDLDGSGQLDRRELARLVKRLMPELTDSRRGPAWNERRACATRLVFHHSVRL